MINDVGNPEFCSFSASPWLRGEEAEDPKKWGVPPGKAVSSHVMCSGRVPMFFARNSVVPGRQLCKQLAAAPVSRSRGVAASCLQG